ncbi:histidine phosphatase family protein [Salinibacterium sp. UTAS2018]|uniref:histidine phosphatase family protein n=1 Tax=Salinibacterium sp. UTAS2018 TaxID=2508880 RepID=UPI0010093E0D|nr:histidine phosphatase family protein [Salinibacterium sp. UTAS2018]QAV71023.1 histidine phosphatase family protein [Salinibacterium sp. UTAS2018]
MPADLIHLVRHGEVHNPDRILYGRLPGYHLSELGHQMADLAAASLEQRPLRALYASPLLRAQESAHPWSQRSGLAVTPEERIIEPHNWFEGGRLQFPQVLAQPKAWPHLINPFKPSWGEAYVSIEARMLAAIDDAWAAADGGEVVMVSHQLPIVMVARSVKKMRLAHDPRNRRCTLSSITTLAREGDHFVEVDYQEPAGELLAASIDLGAV